MDDSEKRGCSGLAHQQDDPGSKYLYEDGFPAGNARFQPVEDCLSEAKSSSEFPCILVPVQSLCHSELSGLKPWMSLVKTEALS